MKSIHFCRGSGSGNGSGSDTNCGGGGSGCGSCSSGSGCSSSSIKKLLHLHCKTTASYISWYSNNNSILISQ